DGRPRVLRRRLLLDGDRGREAFDGVDFGLLHLLEELSGVRGKRLDVAALSFGVDRVECQRRLPRPGQPGDDDELIARDFQVDVLEIVLAGAPDDDPITGHDSPFSQPGRDRATRSNPSGAYGAPTRA